MFTLAQSLGAVGGKPNHAHYFIGFNRKFNYVFFFQIIYKYVFLEKKNDRECN